MNFNRTRRHAVDPAAVSSTDSTGVVVVVDDTDFADRIAGAVTLVDFWAPWCGPCRMFAPVFEDAAAAHHDRVRFAACNVDENPQTAGRLGIMSIPTLVAFDAEGNELGRLTGALPRRDLDRLVDEILDAAGAGPDRVG